MTDRLELPDDDEGPLLVASRGVAVIAAAVLYGHSEKANEADFFHLAARIEKWLMRQPEASS